MNLINQRQGRFLNYQLVQGINGKLRYEPIYNKNSWQELTIAKTLNTVVTCRVCCGAGKILNQDSTGFIIESICNHCNGSKKMKSV